MTSKPKDRTVELAAELDKHKAIASALKVQRDSHQRRNVRLETENRILRRHQEDIRAWLADAIDEFVAARTTGQVLEVADKIHREAVEKLGDARRVPRDHP